jgi:23S rRNA pseudouridine1911/1915/1917 synthase
MTVPASPEPRAAAGPPDGGDLDDGELNGDELNGGEPNDGDSREPAARRVAVTAAAPGRLDRVLADALAETLPELSRSRLKALIEAGFVASDGRTIADPSTPVKPGRRFEVAVPAARPAVPEAQAIDLEIVYEDEWLVVVDKPPGMVVHPAAGNPEGTLVNALLAHCGAELSGIGGVARPGIVHRLDKDTSGLMVVAKTDRAHRALAAQFADRTLSRDYDALVRGVPQPASGEIAGAVGRDPAHRKRMAVVTRGGKPALTRYRTVRAYGPYAALLECSLATGRTHQIRVHMAFVGHPIVGDRLYARRPPARGLGATPLGTFPRQALHARRLRLIHPGSCIEMTWERPPPADFRALTEQMELMRNTIPET